MPADDSVPFLIAGGGIGGLAAALALTREGFNVHVLEAAPAFEELGAGLQIGPNGGRILQGLGLGAGLDAVAARPETLRLMDAITGRRLATVPLGKAALDRYGEPYRVMARHALHRLLAEACAASPSLTISHGFRLQRFDASGQGVRVEGGDRVEPIPGAALIGADGVHSVTRRQLFPDAVARGSGFIALRAVLERGSAAAAWDNAVTVWMAPDAHLVTYPLNAGGALNLVAVLRDDAVPEEETRAVGMAQFEAAFDRWTREARDLIAACPSWRIWPLLALPALSRWGDGPVTLLGDAAHPVLPFLASGAVMALEDAALLAKEVAASRKDPGAAFRRYETRRLPRARRIQRASARMGEIYHMNGPMRLARNAALALAPGWALLARNDWLYGFRA